MTITQFPAHSPGQKGVRVMAEHSTDPFWRIPGWPRESFRQTDISAALMARAEEWNAWYGKHDPVSPSHPNPPIEAVNRHAEEGLRIAQAIKAEHPDWRVFYVDETGYFAAMRGEDVETLIREFEVRACPGP